jgi:ABC-type polar amino acid transport system ATPase subunit
MILLTLQNVNKSFGMNEILKDVNLNEKAEVASRVYWGGKHYDRSNNLM